VSDIEISPSIFVPGNPCEGAVKFPNQTSLSSGSVSQYIPPLTLSRRGKLRLARSGRFERVKLLEICDRTGAVMVCNPSQVEVARLPLIISMPFRVICVRSLPWMLTFPVMVLQLFNASAAAWDSMMKPLGDAQVSVTTCQPFVLLRNTESATIEG